MAQPRRRPGGEVVGRGGGGWTNLSQVRRSNLSARKQVGQLRTRADYGNVSTCYVRVGGHSNSRPLFM